MIPNLFKWINILTTDCLPINEDYKQKLEYADFIVTISDFGDIALKSLVNTETKKINFGPSDIFFEHSDIERNISFMTSCKNAQSTNLGAFIKAMSKKDIEGYLHTNMYDPGDYNIDLLIDRYEVSNVSLPSHYVSVKESISDEEMRDIYLSHTFYIEPSVKSASCLSMLEAMACGCVPIGMNSGICGEIIKQLDDDKLFVPYETYIGANEEEFSIISIKGLSNKILEMNKLAKEKPEMLEKMSNKSRKIALSYRQNDFLTSFNKIVHKTLSSESFIIVDTF